MIRRMIVPAFAVAGFFVLIAPKQVHSAQQLVFGADSGTPNSASLFHVDLDAALATSGAGVNGVFNFDGLVNRIDTLVATPDGNIAFGAGVDISSLGGGSNQQFLSRLDVGAALSVFDDGLTTLQGTNQDDISEALIVLADGSLVEGNTFGGGLLSHVATDNTVTQLLGGQGSFVDIVETSPDNIVFGRNLAGDGFVDHTDLTLALPATSGSGVGTSGLLSGALTVFDVAAGENGAAYSTIYNPGNPGLLTEYTPGSLTREDIAGGLATTGVPMTPLEGLANGNVMVWSEEGGAPGSLLTYDPVTNTQVTPHSQFATGVVTQLIELSDGNVVYAVNNIPGQPIFDTHLRLLNTTTGAETFLLAEAGGSIEEMIPLDDGNFVFTSTLAGGNLSHFDVGTVTRTTLSINQGDFQGLVALFVEDADFDADNDIDGADFLAWQQGFGTNSGATLAQGDANGDGAVNAADLAVWENQYGAVTALSALSGAVAAVPEPASLLLFGLGGMFMLSTRWEKVLTR